MEIPFFEEIANNTINLLNKWKGTSVKHLTILNFKTPEKSVDIERAIHYSSTVN